MIELRSQETEIRWFRSAVKAALILKAGILEEDAENVIKAYDLDRKLRDDPETGLHYDPEEVADEIISEGLVGRSLTEVKKQEGSSL